MELQAVDQLEFSSIFGSSPANPTLKPEQRDSGFSGSMDPNKTSLFAPKAEPELQDAAKLLTKEEQDKVLEQTKTEDKSLFEDKNKVEPQSFNNVRSIFEELIKSNQLLPLEDEKLETPEDVQALISANITHQMEQLKADESNAWYANKSPAWRIVAEFAEKVSHPSELLPFIQSVQTIDSVANLDPKNLDDAESLVRMALISRRESQDIIEETISTYKENGKLANLAEKYQPSLIQQEQYKMENMAKQKDQEEVDNFNMIRQIHEDAIKVLETPFLGKHKMKKEEKAAIYNLIAAPDEQTGGYKIFTAIDNLYEKKDFEKLRKIALLLQDEPAYNGYVGIDITKNVGEGLMRKVKTTSTGGSSAEIEEPQPVKNPRINTGFNKESGFGYFVK